MQELPQFAAWWFVDAVDGFEIVYAGQGELRGRTLEVKLASDREGNWTVNDQPPGDRYAFCVAATFSPPCAPAG